MNGMKNIMLDIKSNSEFLVLTLVLILCLCFGKREKQVTIREDCLQHLNNLRGFFALEIVIGHVVRHESGLIMLFGKFMICSVAFFFFISAMGLVIPYDKKENYLNYRFILSKPLYLFILAVMFFLICFLIDLCGGLQLNYFTYNFLFSFYKNTNWFVWELIIFYFVFYIINIFIDIGLL